MLGEQTIEDSMSDEPSIKFATDADRQAWEIDFMAFGSAMVDGDGRHVPLMVLPLPGPKLSGYRIRPMFLVNEDREDGLVVD